MRGGGGVCGLTPACDDALVDHRSGGLLDCGTMRQDGSVSTDDHSQQGADTKTFVMTSGVGGWRQSTCRRRGRLAAQPNMPMRTCVSEPSQTFPCLLPFAPCATDAYYMRRCALKFWTLAGRILVELRTPCSDDDSVTWWWLDVGFRDAVLAPCCASLASVHVLLLSALHVCNVDSCPHVNLVPVQSC